MTLLGILILLAYCLLAAIAGGFALAWWMSD